MEHRDWCDTELKGNKAAREQKEKRLELTQTELEAKIDSKFHGFAMFYHVFPCFTMVLPWF